MYVVLYMYVCIYLFGGCGHGFAPGGDGVPQHGGQAVGEQHVVIDAALEISKQRTIVNEVPAVRLRKF